MKRLLVLILVAVSVFCQPLEQAKEDFIRAKAELNAQLAKEQAARSKLDVEIITTRTVAERLDMHRSEWVKRCSGTGKKFVENPVPECK